MDREWTGIRPMRFIAILAMMLCFGGGQMWGQSTTYTSNVTLSTSGGTRASTCTVNISKTAYDGIKLGTNGNNGAMQFTIPSGTTTIYIHAAAWNGEAGSMSVSTSVGSITSGSSLSLTADSGVKSSTPFTLDAPANASTSYFFTVTLSNVKSSATITLTTASSKRAVVWGINTVAASCSVNPTIGAASLNGSFNLSTVGVQCASITPGNNCSVASGDYGFIWYANDGTKKEIGGTGVTKVAVTTGAYSSGSFSANLTSTFVLGNRYSVRAFATNGKPATAYSDTITFQPRSVTFNLNGHGSSTPTTQYVNNGGKATDPSYSESVTGYTFGGWYKEAGCSNSWTFGTDVVSGADKTLYAKWTAKTYTIDLDQDLTPTTTGTTSIAVTYNSNSNLTDAITKPTKDGWTFAGYYTEKNGNGTQIIDADGNILASKAGYTDASKNWIGTSDVTLYAKWTCTVTWSVNKLTNVYSAHTLTYNGTSTKVASIPGPPSPASYCGDKFVGWTSVEDYVHGTSNLFTTVAGSPELKTIGDITFYAVFADYDE